MPHKALMLALLAVLLMIPGCGMFGPLVQPATPVSLHEQMLANRDARFFDGRTGEKLYDLSVFNRVKSADVVLFGELHGHPVGLPVAAAIWKDMLRVRDRDETPALLLEFFERDQQIVIDEYLGGMIEEEEFIKKAGRSASNFPEGHQTMFNATRDAGGVVIAANAPRRYVRLARTEGYDHLRAFSPAQRTTFVLPQGEGPKAYRDRFIDLMGGPEMMHGESGPEDFLRSQLVWDATMADTVATALKAGHQPVALVVGRFHIEFDGATRHYLKRQRPGADVLTIVMIDRWSEELADEDKGRGDIVIYVGPVERADEDS
jgi:uncharacterized iron-regulated protein